MTTFLSRLNAIPYDVFANPAASVLLPIALGTSVGFSSRPKQTQTTYLAIKQPPLRPPPQVFGPVWTVLYGLMGYAAHRAVTSVSPLVSTDHMRTLYSMQLGLNLLYMPLFFGLRKPVLALADIVSLVGLNGYLTYLYFSVDSVAGWCQVPYMAWLGFATYLTAGAGYLNNWDISEATLKKRMS
ncbi:putative translocator protein like protein [Hypoxylon sp. FL0890]|nr:putative translocator protein like protein [Hypoxylon sp. FL0890]